MWDSRGAQKGCGALGWKVPSSGLQERLGPPLHVAVATPSVGTHAVCAFLLCVHDVNRCPMACRRHSRAGITRGSCFLPVRSGALVAPLALRGLSQFGSFQREVHR